MLGGNETNQNKPSNAEIWRVLYEFVKILVDDMQNGCEPLIVCGIPEDVMEEFDKTIMSRPEHQGETLGQARDTEIRNFIFETVGRQTKKE